MVFPGEAEEDIKMKTSSTRRQFIQSLPADRRLAFFFLPIVAGLAGTLEEAKVVEQPSARTTPTLANHLFASHAFLNPHALISLKLTSSARRS